MSARPAAPVETAPRLEIDWTRCDGHGLCAALLPERVALDEWGFPLIAGHPLAPQEVPDVRRAVLACPALALRIGNG
jgi:ferredoxin